MDLNQARQEIRHDPMLSRLLKLAKEKNVSFFLVGGYLRDLLLGIRAKDYDFALPKKESSFIETMEEMLHLRFFKVGKEETGTISYRMIKEGMSIDVTFLQGEAIEEDLERRDFTMNAVAFSLRDETFHCAEGALEDIAKNLIHMASSRSIDHDPLRMLRAVRYFCTLEDFAMDDQLKEEIALKKENILNLPAERIRTELDQILLSPRPAVGIKSLYEFNLLFSLFPELKGLRGLNQDEHHHLDALSHTLLIIEKAAWALKWIAQNRQEMLFPPECLLCLYYAALFHDIGKQDTYSKDEKGKVHFYYHEAFSVRAAEKIMERLRFSNFMKDKVLHLIKNHMRILNLSGETKEPALRRLVNQIGDETPLLVLLSLADKEASRGILSVQNDEVVETHCRRILKLFREKDVVHPPPLITGHDVIALGYSPGPTVGEILSVIRHQQVEGTIKNREEALKMLNERFGTKRGG